MLGKARCGGARHPYYIEPTLRTKGGRGCEPPFFRVRVWLASLIGTDSDIYGICALDPLSDVRHSRPWRAAQHPNRLRAPGVGTAQGLVVVRFGEYHNMQCDGQHRSTRCCGLKLVPHTGFPVNRLMCLSRVHQVPPRDTWDIRHRIDKGSNQGSVPASTDGSHECVASVPSAVESMSLLGGAITRGSPRPSFEKSLIGPGVGHRRVPSQPSNAASLKRVDHGIPYGVVSS